MINGLLLGGVLALLSLGLNLVFGVIDVVWICYAELIMLGMYGMYYLYTVYHAPILLAALVSIVCVAVLGLVAVGGLAVTARPLLLTTISPDLAAARGVPVRVVSLTYTIALAVSVGLSSLATGAILSTGMPRIASAMIGLPPMA